MTTHARVNAADEESIEHVRSKNHTKVQCSEESVSLVNKGLEWLFDQLRKRSNSCHAY